MLCQLRLTPRASTHLLRMIAISSTHSTIASRTSYRPFTTCFPSMAPKFAEGSDTAKLEPELEALLSTGWLLNEAEDQISKTFYFKTYTKDFHHLVGVRSKSANHHPIMQSEFGSLTIHWTTHHPSGLTAKDTKMARFCDEHARLIGTVERGEGAKCGPAATKAGTETLGAT